MKKLFVHDMVQNNPGLEKYKSRYNEPLFLKRRGYDGKVFDLFECAQFALEWKYLDAANPERPPVFPEESDSMKWTREKRLELKREYLDMKENGIQVFFMMDMIVLPERVVEIYPEITNEKGEIDILKPKMREILDCLFVEMFDVFPEIDGIYIRYGETYVGKKYLTPYHRGNNPILEPEKEYHLFLMNYLRDTICSRYGRKIFYRTWGFGKFGRFQYDPEMYLAVSSMLEPHPLFYFCIKHTQGDFHRLCRFNQCLNTGIHHQVVEVQAAREYEGKGAYPNYIAGGVVNGFEELDWLMKKEEKKCLKELFEQESVVDGIWIWSRGGGWGGPYIDGNAESQELPAYGQHEIWADVNAYVLARWAKDMSGSDQSYVMEYAKEELGMSKQDAERFYLILQLSAQAVLLGRGTTIREVEWDIFWTRDQNISFERFMRNIKNVVVAGKLRELLKEKSDSRYLWKRIVAVAEEMSGKSDLRDYIITTCRYGYYLYAIYETLFRGNILVLKEDIGAVEKAVVEYDQLWKKWEQLYENAGRCPTLFARKANILDMGGYCTNTGLDRAAEPMKEFVRKKDVVHRNG